MTKFYIFYYQNNIVGRLFPNEYEGSSFKVYYNKLNNSIKISTIKDQEEIFNFLFKWNKLEDKVKIMEEELSEKGTEKQILVKEIKLPPISKTEPELGWEEVKQQ